MPVDPKVSKGLKALLGRKGLSEREAQRAPPEQRDRKVPSGQPPPIFVSRMNLSGHPMRSSQAMQESEQ